MPGTVKLHRVFTAKPEKVFRALTDADALTKWMSPDGFTAHVDHMDVKVGGTYKMSFTNFTTGNKQGFGGTYREIEPNKCLVYTDQFDNPALPGEIKVTITLNAVSVGTEVHITQEGIPDMIPAEACYLGWQESLMNLARLVNPEINEG